MTRSDDKPRSTGIREASKLRPTLGTEPGSGYAFHDQTRVDRVERPRPARSVSGAPQAASHAPRERSYARTLVGNVTLEDALANDVLHDDAALANDQGPDAKLEWLARARASAADASEREDLAQGRGPTNLAGAGAKRESSQPPAGGAIWQALPPLTELPDGSAGRESLPDALELELIDDAAVTSVPPGLGDARPASRTSTDPPRSSQPVGYRPSAAELGENYRSAYGDPRLIKYEGLVERNAWEQLYEAISREQSLSPQLRLLSIVAQRETLQGGRKQDTARLTQEAIAAVAELLNVPHASPTALVLGKRLLRKNPGWANKQQPTPGLSLGVLLGGIAAGAGVGWLVTTLLF